LKKNPISNRALSAPSDPWTTFLRPSVRHHPVERWVTPDEFVEHAQFAEGLGFAGVLAGPLVRSSYRAGRLYAQAVRSRPAVS
jgi:lipoic acid synthetase